MGDRQTAIEACDGAQKDRLAKLAGAFMDEYLQADGKPDADALRQACGQRFQAGLKVYAAAHAAASRLAAEVFPANLAAGA